MRLETVSCLCFQVCISHKLRDEGTIRTTVQLLELVKNAFMLSYPIHRTCYQAFVMSFLVASVEKVLPSGVGSSVSVS
jgi:hypothetical protein